MAPRHTHAHARAHAWHTTPKDLDAARGRRRRRLAQSVELLRSSEGFRSWLRAMKRLHHYSPQNVRLIVAQCPEATYVASFRRWREELGYQVRKGERGLMIFVPRVVRIRPQDADNEGIEDRDGRRVIFRAGHVFDRSQVEPIPGKALPLEAPAPSPLVGDSHAHLVPRLEGLASEIGFRVERRALPVGVGGSCDQARKVIAVRSDQSPNAEVRVLAHELAHALGVGYRTHGRERAECVVECAAYLALASAGLDVEASSVPYIAGWASDEEQVIERDAAEIDRVARWLERALRPSEKLAAQGA